jgi:hypothetical protein
VNLLESSNNESSFLTNDFTILVTLRLENKLRTEDLHAFKQARTLDSLPRTLLLDCAIFSYNSLSPVLSFLLRASESLLKRR